jgi:hypothetical protein
MSTQQVGTQWWQEEHDMTKYLSKLVALALFAVALTGAALAQNDAHAVRANIPFSFYAGGKLLPAGEYKISVNVEGRMVFIGQNVTGRGSFLLGSPDDRSRDGRTVLTFKLVGGEVYALRELRGPDSGMSFNAPGSRHALSAQNQKSQSVEIVAELR